MIVLIVLRRYFLRAIYITWCGDLQEARWFTCTARSCASPKLTPLLHHIHDRRQQQQQQQKSFTRKLGEHHQRAFISRTSKNINAFSLGATYRTVCGDLLESKSGLNCTTLPCASPQLTSHQHNRVRRHNKKRHTRANGRTPSAGVHFPNLKTQKYIFLIGYI